MFERVTRRLVLGGTMGMLAGSVWAKAPAVSLRPQLRPAVPEPGKPDLSQLAPARDPELLVEAAKLGGEVSFAVLDIAAGEVLEARNGTMGQPPASVTKAVTALYALDVLGPSYRFETRLVANGQVRNGVLHGDLVLAGGGDPTLDTDALAGMAAQLKSAGIREVKGRLRVWGGALPFARVVDATQPEHVGYNPSVSGLNLNFNRVHFEWRRSGGSYTVTMDARSGRYRPDVRVARMTVVPRALPVYTYTDRGDHDAWTVARDALGNAGARWLPVRKPEAYAAEVFATFARSHGIALRIGEQLGAAPGGQVLATHRSGPLTDILRDMLKFSTNITAEVVGMTVTARRRGSPTALRASAGEMSAWARSTLGMAGAELVDHSGLGEDSRLTAAAMATALSKVHGVGQLKPILKPFPMRHADGRVNERHPVKVLAKTGTLYFVSSLAGYLTAPDGRDLAFAIFTANQQLRDGFDSASGQRPQGSRSWNGRSKGLQQALIERWARIYGT